MNRTSSTRPRKRTMTTISHDSVAHRFTTEVDGSHAELEYSLSGAVMAITHTRVPPAIGGRGVAAELMGAALAAARDAGWSVQPICSYAVAYMARHPEHSGKQHMDELLDEALDESFPASDSPAVGGSS
jgi:predicted GNAT family acetyltransferase